MMGFLVDVLLAALFVVLGSVVAAWWLAAAFTLVDIPADHERRFETFRYRMAITSLFGFLLFWIADGLDVLGPFLAGVILLVVAHTATWLALRRGGALR